MKTSSKYKIVEHSFSDQAGNEKYSKIYDPERMETIKRFLFDNPKNNYCNIKAAIDHYSPLTYDCSDFTVNLSKETQKRFISWYGSNVCVKMLMTFENNLLNYGSNDRSKYAKQAFLIEHVLRIREIYQRAISFDKLAINDIQDFKHLALFFEQIEQFICYEINQTIPMDKELLQDNIYECFYDLCSDVTEISDFNDVYKIINVDFEEYVFDIGKTSLQPSSNGSELYTFNLVIVDQETRESLFDNFTEIDLIDYFEPELDAFLEDSLHQRSKIDSLLLDNPFASIINTNSDPF
jgi:hypothetical protein